MIDILRQIAVVLGALAFLGVCWWAFSPKRKKRFEEDARLPFADEEHEEPSATDEKPSAIDDKEESSETENADKKEQQRQNKQ